MAAAGATLDIIEQDNLPENAHVVGEYLIKKLKALKNPRIGEVRGMGLMIGIELVKEGKAPNADLAVKVLDATKDAGLLIGKGGLDGNVLRIKPPLMITKADADFIAATIGKVLDA